MLLEFFAGVGVQLADKKNGNHDCDINHINHN